MRLLSVLTGLNVITGTALAAPPQWAFPTTNSPATADLNASQLTKRVPALKFAYGQDKVRGVNLGGWFVLEPWITPSIFEPYQNYGVVDEYTLTQHLGKDAATQLLSSHWESWITEPDFAAIAAAGLNHVRIPIGYWSVFPLPGDPYVQGAYDVLGRSLDWAQAHGLKVLIDLHGAPGSQNGFDNSGRKGAIDWTKGDTVGETLAAIRKIRDDHANHPAVAAIELLNEPMGPQLNVNTITQFYYDGWGNLMNSPVAITFHDAFEGVTSWNSFGQNLYNLVLDTHHYEVFDNGQVAQPHQAHVASACGFGRSLSQSNKIVVTGEWTGAETDCAKWLNGLGIGARYDGTYPGSPAVGSCAGKSTGTVAALSAQDKANIRSFIEAQLDAYEQHGGWIWWTWKTEGAPEWDMKDQIANGVFPQPLNARQYPGQCN